MAAPAQTLSNLQLGVFVRLLLGYPRWRIAAEMAEDEGVVQALEQSPEVLQAMADARQTLVANSGDIQAKFSSISMDAAGVLENLMHGARNEAVRRAAARDVLEFAGHRPAETVNHNVRAAGVFNISALDPTEMEFLRTVAEKAARAFATGTTTPPPLPGGSGSGSGFGGNNNGNP